MNTHRATVPAREPLVSTATITAAVSAAIALLVAFGVDLTETQTTAILGVVAVLAPLVVILARRWVTPNDKVVELDDDGMIVAGKGHDTIPEGEKIRAVHDA